VGTLREYVVKVLRLWKQHVSGWVLAIIAIALAIAAAYVSNDPSASAMVVKISALITVAAALWMLVIVAPYDAWKDEREKREAEEHKNQLPDIQGYLQEFVNDEQQLATTGITGNCRYIRFTCIAHLAGHRPIETNLTGVVMDGSALDPPAQFRDLTISPVVIQYARETVLSVAGKVLVPRAFRGKLSLNGLRCSVFDGLGNRHSQIEMFGDEYLEFD